MVEFILYTEARTTKNSSKVKIHLIEGCWY